MALSNSKKLPRMHHAGLWLCPADLDAALSFFQGLLDYSILSRGPRKSGGERVFLSNESGQFIEILVSDEVEIPPQRPPHPKGRVRGVCHLCFAVEDAITMKAKLLECGYEVALEVPAGLDGYASSDLGAHRILFFEGPAGLSFEFFEFQRETYPMS